MKAHRINRREFLAVGAAVGFPAIVPATVLGKTPPSERVHVGLIGCGGISRYYHRNYLKRMTDVRIVAVCDAYTSRRDAAVTELNGHYGRQVTTAHADFREVLARSDVDAVIVAAHDNWHTPMSIAAARAGKDVFCQKPLALDLSRTALLRKAVHDKKRVFQFGTQYRSMGRWRLMVELVRNGYVGELKKVHVWSRDVLHDAARYHVKPYGSTQEIPVPEDLDYDAWMGPSHMAPYTADRCTNWGGYHCPETSLGFVAGCGIHPLGIAQWGNKTDDTSPIHYEGTGAVPQEGIYRTLEQWDVTCRYANGVALRFMNVRAAKSVVEKYQPAKWRPGDGVVFHGTDGWIGNFWGAFYASNQTIWKAPLKPDDERLPVATEHNRNFIDCVKSRAETMCPVEMAIRCDTICHLTNVAARTGRAIRWDPKTEQIVGDAEASGMLARPCRKKWKVW